MTQCSLTRRWTRWWIGRTSRAKRWTAAAPRHRRRRRTCKASSSGWMLPRRDPICRFGAPSRRAHWCTAISLFVTQSMRVPRNENHLLCFCVSNSALITHLWSPDSVLNLSGRPFSVTSNQFVTDPIIYIQPQTQWRRSKCLHFRHSDWLAKTSLLFSNQRAVENSGTPSVLPYLQIAFRL